jgi:hypothetical protein
MTTEANGFKSIELVNDGSTAKLVFDLADDKTAEVEMPLAAFERGISEMLRIVESASQQKGASAGGIQQISFSTAQTIEPRADIAAARMYLVIDRGMPHEIAYGLRMLVLRSKHMIHRDPDRYRGCLLANRSRPWII